MNDRLSVFIAYSHENADVSARFEQILKQHCETFCDIFSDRDCRGHFNKEIISKLLNSDLFIFLISTDFWDSEYTHSIEATIAFHKERRREALVIPVLLESVGELRKGFEERVTYPMQTKTGDRFNPILRYDLDKRDWILDITASQIRGIADEIAVAKSKEKKSILPLEKTISTSGNLYIAGDDGLHGNRNRIVVLLPLHMKNYNNDIHFNKEVLSAVLGIGNGIKSIRELDLTSNFEFLDNLKIVLRNHGNDPCVARDVIKEELKYGTRHFIATMSAVCTILSGKNNEDSDCNFQNITKSLGITDAHLLITIATSQHIEPKANVYKLFPSVLREAGFVIDDLKSKIPKNNSKKIVFISSDEDANEYHHCYLNELYTEYKSYLTNYPSTGLSEDRIKDIYINNRKDIKEKLSLKENRKIINDAFAIFVICKYDINEKIIEEVVKFIDKNSQPYLVVPSALPGFNYTNKIFPYIGDVQYSEINKFKWLYAVPKKGQFNKSSSKQEKEFSTDENADTFYGDLAEYFMNISIRIMVDIMNNKEYILNSGSKTFDNLWKDNLKNRIIPKHINLLYKDNYRNPDVELILKESSNIRKISQDVILEIGKRKRIDLNEIREFIRTGKTLQIVEILQNKK